MMELSKAPRRTQAALAVWNGGRFCLSGAGVRRRMPAVAGRWPCGAFWKCDRMRSRAQLGRAGLDARKARRCFELFSRLRAEEMNHEG